MQHTSRKRETLKRTPLDECGKENTIFNWIRILSRRQSWSWLLMAHDQLCFTRTEHLLLNMGILLVESWHQFVDLQNDHLSFHLFIVPFFFHFYSTGCSTVSMQFRVHIYLHDNWSRCGIYRLYNGRGHAYPSPTESDLCRQVKH